MCVLNHKAAALLAFLSFFLNVTVKTNLCSERIWVSEEVKKQADALDLQGGLELKAGSPLFLPCPYIMSSKSFIPKNAAFEHIIWGL